MSVFHQLFPVGPLGGGVGKILQPPTTGTVAATAPNDAPSAPPCDALGSVALPMHPLRKATIARTEVAVRMVRSSCEEWRAHGSWILYRSLDRKSTRLKFSH